MTERADLQRLGIGVDTQPLAVPVPLGLRRIRTQRRQARRLSTWLLVAALAMASAVLVHLFTR